MYDETPLCCPARATFLTGRHTFHHGVTRNDGDLLDPATTVAVALHDAGYHTIQAGKYLNGYDGDRQPVGWDHTAIVRSLGTATYWRDGQLVTYRPEYVDAATGRQAVDWIPRCAAWPTPVQLDVHERAACLSRHRRRAVP